MSYSAMSRTYLQDGESISKVSNPINLTPSDTGEVNWEKIPSLQPWSSSLSKKTKAGKAAGCKEMRPEKLCREQSPWADSCMCSGLVLRKGIEDWQTGVINPIYKKGYMNECTNYRDIFLFELPGKVYVMSLVKEPRKKLSQSWMIPRAVFMLPAALKTKMPLCTIFSTNIGRISRAAYVLLTSKKQYDQIPGESCGTAVLTASCTGRQVIVCLLRSLLPCRRS